MNQKHTYYVSPEIDEDLKIKGKMAWKNVLQGFAKPKTFEKNDPDICTTSTSFAYC